MDQSAKRLDHLELEMKVDGEAVAWHLNPLKIAQDGWVVTLRHTESPLQAEDGKVTEMLEEYVVKWSRKLPWIPPEQRGEMKPDVQPSSVV